MDNTVYGERVDLTTIRGYVGSEYWEIRRLIYGGGFIGVTGIITKTQ